MTIHFQSRKARLALGFVMGIAFGFLLQKAGVARYEVVVGQLLLKDFTVLKVMLSAVVTGMIGVYALKGLGLARLHPKHGSWGASAIGGLIFGVGFALLGYCPGTLAAAIGQGNLDALAGGLIGIVLGAGVFASLYPGLQVRVLSKGDFGDVTIPQLLKINPWFVIVPLCSAIVAFLLWLEASKL
ncbi:MAG: YeeE/YedE thiosulfate transporter family protein [Planctomycetota bacterium]|nr:YeeE/YedE thiosulfate transporter family protein [Planctomycetota bacterium]